MNQRQLGITTPDDQFHESIARCYFRAAGIPDELKENVKFKSETQVNLKKCRSCNIYTLNEICKKCKKPIMNKRGRNFEKSAKLRLIIKDNV